MGPGLRLAWVTLTLLTVACVGCGLNAWHRITTEFSAPTILAAEARDREELAWHGSLMTLTEGGWGVGNKWFDENHWQFVVTNNGPETLRLEVTDLLPVAHPERQLQCEVRCDGAESRPVANPALVPADGSLYLRIPRARYGPTPVATGYAAGFRIRAYAGDREETCDVRFRVTSTFWSYRWTLLLPHH